ncbi:MAG: hypothetical protein ACJAS1_000588 [Oleiphilaceae bacterium]|jgi:hypothetical protein
MEETPDYFVHFRPETFRRYEDGWVAPNIDELREAKRRSGKTGSQLAAMMGVNSRTLRKWIGGLHAIPYAAWMIWLFSIKLITEDRLVDRY